MSGLISFTRPPSNPINGSIPAPPTPRSVGPGRGLHGLFAAVAVLLALAALLGASPASAAALATYSEPLTLEWGDVEFRDGDLPVTEEVWFARRPPSFDHLDAFSDAERQCLVDALGALEGLHDGARVWRMDGTLSGEFLRRLLDNRCLRTTNVRPPARPDDWIDGPTVMAWEFRLRYEDVSDEDEDPPAEPTLELALLLDDIPVGSAWRVPLAAALATPAIQALASLTPGEAEAVASTDPWASLFLVAPGTLHPDVFPPVSPMDPEHLDRFAVPLAFGVRALAEIAPILGARRAFLDATYERLEATLNPDSPAAFPGAHQWFPEAEASRRRLDTASVETGTASHRLVRLAIPPPSGPFRAPRVRPDAHAWVLQVGPFRRLAPSQVTVGQIQGATTNVPVDRLPILVTDPARLEGLLTDVRTLEARLETARRRHQPLTEDFFWLPDVVDPHRRAVRSMEATRFAGPVQSRFLTNRFEYVATYVPAAIHGKLGASYTPEQGFGATAEAGWSGLVRPGDALALQTTVAERLLEGDLRYQLPLPRSLDRRTTHDLLVLGQAGRNSHFRLGSLSDDTLRHDTFAAGLGHEIRHQGGAWEVLSGTELLWDAHRLTFPGDPESRRDEGLLLRHRQLWRFAPRPHPPGPVLWDSSVAPQLAVGPAVGWAEAFVSGEVALGVRASFGGEDRQAYSVGVRGSLGMASAGLPPPLLFPFSGSERLVGLEPGEYSGRSFAHAELALGCSLDRWLGRLFRDDQGRPAPPAALGGLGLQGLAEIGSISPDGGFGAFRDSAETVSSFGIALEKALPPGARGTALRLGYAWSPDSVRTGGRLFTALNWGF